jgi:hypothetical protein
MQNRTYAQLLDTIEALAGVDSFDPSSEEGKILSFVNRRAFAAYSASSVWERFVIVGEPRTVLPGQLIPFSEDAFYLYGAGKSDANGLYTPNGTENGKVKYSLLDADDTETFKIFWDSGPGQWFVRDVANSLNYYVNADTGDTPPISGWTVFVLGSEPAPTVRDLPDIGEFNRIHRKQPFLNSSALEYDFYVDADGAHVMNISPTDSTSVWVTYKKEFTDYTTSSTDIPFEWFEFLAHGAYADFLRMDGQLDAAMVEEDRAKEYLMWSLEKAQSRNNKSNIGKRIRTYGTTQRRG